MGDWIRIAQHLRNVTRWGPPTRCQDRSLGVGQFTVDIRLAVYESCGPSLRLNQPLGTKLVEQSRSIDQTRDVTRVVRYNFNPFGHKSLQIYNDFVLTAK